MTLSQQLPLHTAPKEVNAYARRLPDFIPSRQAVQADHGLPLTSRVEAWRTPQIQHRAACACVPTQFWIRACVCASGLAYRPARGYWRHDFGLVLGVIPIGIPRLHCHLLTYPRAHVPTSRLCFGRTTRRDGCGGTAAICNTHVRTAVPHEGGCEERTRLGQQSTQASMRLLQEAQGTVRWDGTVWAVQEGFNSLRISPASEEEGTKGLEECQGATCAATDRRYGQWQPDEPNKSTSQWCLRKLGMVVGDVVTCGIAGSHRIWTTNKRTAGPTVLPASYDDNSSWADCTRNTHSATSAPSTLPVRHPSVRLVIAYCAVIGQG